jgi:hypothetical protein
MLKQSPPALALLALFGCNAPKSAGGDAGPPMCTNISGTTSQDGLTYRKPEADAEGCHIVPNPDGTSPANVCMQKTPDLSCLGMTAQRGTPVNVTLTGCVKAFGIDSTSYDLTVTVLRETAPNGMRTDPGYAIGGMAGMQAENTPAAVIGHTISTQVPLSDCVDQGGYTIPNVPTETPLIIRVTQQNEDAANRNYVDTYQYNVILSNSEVQDAMGQPVTDPVTHCSTASCRFVRNTNTVENATFTVIAHAAGVSSFPGQDDLYDGVGDGHIAGEVRDCTSIDKIQNAVVALDTQPIKVAYFNVGFGGGIWNIDDPKPEGTRQRTNADGLYTAIAINTQMGGQPVKIGAAITPAVCPNGVCKCNADGTPNSAWSGSDPSSTVLGDRTVYVFPDSITILTFDKTLYEGL